MVFVPHRKHLWISTAVYGDRFTFLYADGVRTSLKTHSWASTACYGDGFASRTGRAEVGHPIQTEESLEDSSSTLPIET
jgi:hypothetical protein